MEAVEAEAKRLRAEQDAKVPLMADVSQKLRDREQENAAHVEVLPRQLGSRPAVAAKAEAAAKDQWEGCCQASVGKGSCGKGRRGYGRG